MRMQGPGFSWLGMAAAAMAAAVDAMPDLSSLVGHRRPHTPLNSRYRGKRCRSAASMRRKARNHGKAKAARWRKAA